jgi:hypothetical protein
MPDFRAEAMPMSFVYARRHNLPRRTQVFMAWLGALLAPSLEGHSAL